MTDHVRQVHEKKTYFDCPHQGCGSKFYTMRIMRIHIQTVHEHTRDFHCEKCNKNFSSIAYLRVHRCAIGTGISSGEKACREAFDALRIRYECEACVVKGSTGYWLPFDFRIYLDDGTWCLVEYDGEQHFRPVRFGGMSQERADQAFEIVKVNDAIKTKYCIDNNIRLLRIKYTDYANVMQIITDFIGAIPLSASESTPSIRDNNHSIAGSV